MYKHTHVSYFDGSPAMLVRERKGAVRMMNECGDQWSDPAWWWIPIGSETQEDYDRWQEQEDDQHDEYTSGADYMASYYNSDSYIAYLNGH